MRAITGVFALMLVGVGLTLPLARLVPAARAQEPKEKSRPAKSLTIMHDGNWNEKLCLVTLYQEGKPFRSAELEQGSTDHKSVTWEKLPTGLYEVHFEAAGFKKFIKRVVLAEDGPELVLKVQLDLNTPQTLGAGPSTDRLAQDLAALKKEQAEMQKQIADLRAEIAKLKK
jgi:hypothetical protein